MMIPYENGLAFLELLAPTSEHQAMEAIRQPGLTVH